MQKFSYFVILFDGRTPDLSFINPRVLTVDGINRFVYGGPIPGYWRGVIARRHGITSPFDVMWLVDKPPVPSEAYPDEPDDRPSVFLVDA